MLAEVVAWLMVGGLCLLFVVAVLVFAWVVRLLARSAKGW